MGCVEVGSHWVVPDGELRARADLVSVRRAGVCEVMDGRSDLQQEGGSHGVRGGGVPWGGWSQRPAAEHSVPRHQAALGTGQGCHGDVGHWAVGHTEWRVGGRALCVSRADGMACVGVRALCVSRWVRVQGPLGIGAARGRSHHSHRLHSTRPCLAGGHHAKRPCWPRHRLMVPRSRLPTSRMSGPPSHPWSLMSGRRGRGARRTVRRREGVHPNGRRGSDGCQG
jgi:hypothetical protein